MQTANLQFAQSASLASWITLKILYFQNLRDFGVGTGLTLCQRSETFTNKEPFGLTSKERRSMRTTKDSF